MAVKLRSFAKINLGLRIGPPGLRADGFHELRTAYQTIALHDRLTVAVSAKGSGVEICCNDARVPTDSSNTCWKAAERVMAALKTRGGVVITIDKRLPVQGGIGAASGNAATVIVGLEKALRKQLPMTERLRIAAEVGSDVPLFLIGGTVMGIGRGEQVFPLPDLPALDLVIVTPEIGVSTPKAFKDWDLLFAAEEARAVLKPGEPTLGHPEPNPHPSAAKGSSLRMGHLQLTVEEQSRKLELFSRELSAWLSSGSAVVSGVPARGGNRVEAKLLDLVRTGIENDFERVFPQFPVLQDLKQALVRHGARYASLSGSGSTVYGIFRDRAAAVKAAKRISAEGTPAQATKMLPRAQYWRKMVAG